MALTATNILTVAKAVTRGVAREERLIDMRDRAEDRGNLDSASRLQDELDALSEARWRLYEQAVEVGIIRDNATEEDLIERSRRIADMSVYAVHREFGVERA